MKVMVFSPHPDDAEIFMGGTIVKYTQVGHDVVIVLVTIPNKMAKRGKESIEAAEILGAKLDILSLNPYELVFNRKLVEAFDIPIKNYAPDVIYTSWIHDSHQDHIAVCQATMASARRNNCSMYMYDQGLSSGFTPYVFKAQTFVDISDTMELKIKSISAHKSQVEHYGDRWIAGMVARATYLGYRINTKYAEGFEIIKEIQRI